MTNNPFTPTDDPTDDETADTLFDDPGPITEQASDSAASDPEPTDADRDRVPDADAVDGASAVWDAITDSRQPSVGNYRAHTTRKDHYHSPTKHDITDVFDANSELVADVLYYAPDDHAAVHELIARRDELVDRDADIFTDTGDENEERWHSIESAAQRAEISDATREFLIEEFDYDEQFDTTAAPRY